MKKKTYRFAKGQRVFCAREGCYLVLTSGPRLRASDMRPGLNPPHDAKAIPSYDGVSANGMRGTYPETDLQSVSAHRWNLSSGWVDKHKGMLTFALGVVSAGITAAKLFLQ